jgi:hypothetical protein
MKIQKILLVFALSFPLFFSAYHTPSAFGSELTISDLEIRGIDGNTLSYVPNGEIVTVSLTLTSSAPGAQKYVLLVEFRDAVGVTTNLQFQSSTLEGGSSTTTGFSWISTVSGVYDVRAFAVSDLARPEVLSSVFDRQITVGASDSGTYYDIDEASYYGEIIVAKILDANTKLGDAGNYLSTGHFEDAYQSSLDAKELLTDAKERYIQSSHIFDKDQSEFIEFMIMYHDDLSTLSLRSSEVLLELNDINYEIQAADTDEEVMLLLPRMDLFFRSLDELGQDWIDYTGRLKQYQSDYPSFPITDEGIQAISEVGNMLHNIAALGKDSVAQLESEYSSADYTSVEDVEIPSEDQDLTSSGLITSEMAQFFDSFDTNSDSEIDIGEAQEFYYWVENNIQYRYDNEYELEPIVGYTVGDGRSGVDYRQTPSETFYEAFGDCEDMATLEQAFYNYFGIEAYVVGVNAQSQNVIDHAATIVRIADDVETFQELLGGLVYYDYTEGGSDIYGNEITPGIYMLVDNAYSDAYGYLSNGLEPDTFTVQCLVPLEYGYDEEWNQVTYYCAIPMD